MNQPSRGVTLFLLVLLVAATALQFHKALHWGHSYWQTTEWLIDYAGGFVRRGLPGAIFFYFAAATGIFAYDFVLAVSFLAFIALTAIFVILGKDRLPLYLIASPVLLAAPAYGEFIVRKDVPGVLLLAICVFIHRITQPASVRIVLINLFAVTAVLSHEGFFFFGAPALMLVLSDGNWRRLPTATATLLPVLLAFGFSVMFHGNPAIAKAVNNSWSELWPQIDPTDCCFAVPNASIDALQWTTHQALGYSAGLLSGFSHGIYVPAAWLVTIVLCFWFMVGFLDQTGSKRLAAILCFQLVMIAPLFVLGWDFGRWIFLWTASSLTLYLFDIAIDLPFLSRLGEVLARISRRCAPRPWYLLILGVPPCCWSTVTYVMSTPLGYPFRAAGLLP